MNKAAFHSAGRLDIEMFINRFRVQRFVFTVEAVPFTITGMQWQLVIKDNEGSLDNLLSLTLGSGLSFPIYETNVLEARFEAIQTKIQEGKKYWALIRIDTNEIWVNGHAWFGYGPFDSSGSDQDTVVNISDNTVEVQLQAIVYTSTDGGTGTFEIVDYTGIASVGLPTGVDAGYIARVVLESPFTPVVIGGVPYEHNAIIYKNEAGDWISWSANYGTQT